MKCECTVENGKATKLYKSTSLLCDHNRLSMILPGVVKLWSPKNPFSPHDVAAGSNKTVILICNNLNCAAETKIMIGEMSRGSGRIRCVKCQSLVELRALPSCTCPSLGLISDFNGRMVCVHNSLLSAAPNVVNFWHSSNKVTPDKIPALCCSKVILICPTGHEKKEMASRLAKTKSYACMECELLENNAARRYPYLICEVNDGTDLTKYSYGSQQIVEWRCFKVNCGYVWKTMIQTRTLQCHGCPQCAGNAPHTYESFLEKANRVHNNKYIYPPKPKNFNLQMRLDIKCPVADHGTFNQVAQHHAMPRGCPICGKTSKGETLIAQTLTEMGIIFERQKKYEGLKNITYLAYDFYVPAWNVIIEFDGIQHFITTNWSNDNDGNSVLARMRKDLIKDQFAVDNGLSLLRIPYTDITNIPFFLSTLNTTLRPGTLFIATYSHYIAAIDRKTHAYIEIKSPPIDWSTVK